MEIDHGRGKHVAFGLRTMWRVEIAVLCPFAASVCERPIASIISCLDLQLFCSAVNCPL